MNSNNFQEIWKQVRHYVWRMNPFRTDYSDHFNTPIVFLKGEYCVNERILELPFVYNQLVLDGEGQRALDFGCTRSPLVLSLLALGYKVVGVDLRPYPFTHPNFMFYHGNLLKFDDEQGFDVITAISVIEHIGLGAYKETPDVKQLQKVIDRLVVLLKDGGQLIITTPVGKPHIDSFLRSFSPEEVKTLFAAAELELVTEKYFRRASLRFWYPADAESVASVQNDLMARSPTGVNGVGCFVWKKRLQ